MPRGAFTARIMPRTATSEAVTSRVQIAICTPRTCLAPQIAARCADCGGLPFVACSGWLCHPCRAGMIPNTTPLANDRKSPARYTRRVYGYRQTFGSRAERLPGLSISSNRPAHIMPAAPPSNDTSTVSVRSC